MLSGAERDFSFSIPASAVAKGRDVRLVFTVMTEGGALANNAFAVNDIIVQQKGNSVDRIFALARSAMSATVSGINAAITAANTAIAAVRASVATNTRDNCHAESQRFLAAYGAV